MSEPFPGLIAVATQQATRLRRPIDSGDRYINRWERYYIATLIENLSSSLKESRDKHEELAKKLDTFKEVDVKEEVKKFFQVEIKKTSQEIDKIREASDEFETVLIFNTSIL